MKGNCVVQEDIYDIRIILIKCYSYVKHMEMGQHETPLWAQAASLLPPVVPEPCRGRQADLAGARR